MSKHMQTTIEQTSSTVLLIAQKSVFVTQLCVAVEALHLTIVRIDPENIPQVIQTQQGRDLFSKAYVCLYLDVPLFTDQEKKRKWIDTTLLILRDVVRIPIYFMLFDARHTRKMGREGQDPISASVYLASRVTELFETGRTFVYQHVFYPYEGGVSLVQRMLFEKIQQGNRLQLLGDCTPLWYTDVISHITQTLCETGPSGGIFSGRQSIPLYTIEEHLRQRSHLPSIQTSPLPFSFGFEPATGIGETSIETMIDQLALVTPKPFRVAEPDVQIQTPLLVAKKPEAKISKSSQKAGRAIVRGVFALLAIVCVLYLLTAIYFFVSLAHMRNTLQSFVQSSPKEMSVLKESGTINDRLSLLHTIATHIPLPYAMVGMSLHRLEVVNSLENIQELLSGLNHSQTASQRMGALVQGKIENTESTHEEIATQLEESYKELSSVQARLSQQDLGLDLLLGLDGFSRELLTKISLTRESVSSQKAISSVLTTLLNQEKATTIALVRADSSTARPLLGIPQEVVLVGIEKGKVSSVKGYSVQSLDGMLKGKVDPPEEMKAYAGAAGWKLSDGAWSVDGTTASRQVAWFLSKQLHVDVDALLMIDDLQVKKSLIALESGTTTLVSQEPSLPSVLGAQSEATDLELLVNKLQKASGEELEPFTFALSQAVAQSDMTIYIREATGAKTIHALAWDGGVLTPPCPPSFAIDRDCTVGSFYLAEYDIKKAENDTYVQRKDELHKIQIAGGAILHTDEVTFAAPKLTAQQKLLKYVVDSDAVPTQLSINGADQFLTGAMIGQEFGKTTISVPLTLEPGVESHVQLIYKTAAIKNEKSTYAFFVQKQPGKLEEPLSVEMTFEKGFVPKIIAPQAAIGRASVAFSTKLDTNKLFAVGF
ncbi:MAG: hypothetical protein ABI758_03095 [Candidatus Woesebacteria bacterium]